MLVCRALLVAALLGMSSAWAEPITVDLRSEASTAANNDMARATIFAEATALTPNEVSKKVNRLVADATKTLKKYPEVKTKTSNTHTYPVYSEKGKVESWRMRYDLVLETLNIALLSDVLGELQQSMAVASVNLLPSPDARKKAENEAILAALAAFKARAQMIADSEGRPYHIKQMNVGVGDRFDNPIRMSRAESFSAKAAPMPIEAGETQISVNVSGQIEIE